MVKCIKQEEVTTLYGSQSAMSLEGSSNNLLSYWKIDAGDGNVIYDQTGNLNHATRQTATWGTSSPVYVNPIVNKSVDEDNSISVDISAFSFGAGGFTYAAQTDNDEVSAVVSNSDNTVTLTGSQNWFGTTVVSVNATNDGNTSNSQTFTLTVNSVNDAPVIQTMANASINEDAVYTIEIPVSDVEQEISALTFAIGGESRFASEVTNGNLTITPEADWNGEGIVSITVTDDAEATAVETFTLTVIPVPDAPLFTDQEDTSVDEDAVLNLTLVASDADNDDLTYSVGAINSVSSEINGTTLTLTPELNFNGAREVTVTVDDGTELTDQQTFTLTVNPINDDPVVQLINDQSMNEDATLEIAIVATDVDNINPDDVLTYTSFTSETNFTLGMNNNIVSITPAQDWNGSGNISVVATDAVGASHTRTFSVLVQPVSDAPVITVIAPQTVEEDGSITIPLSATDVDEGDTKTFNVASVENLTTEISTDGNNLIITPDTDFFGESSVSVTVTDSDDLTDITSFILTTTPVNDAPLIASFDDIVNVDENGTVTVQLSATDVDNDLAELTFGATSELESLEFEFDGTELTINSTGDFNGNTSVIVTVYDPDLLSNSETLFLNVIPQNDAPVISTIDDITMNEDATQTVTLIGSDPDGDDINFVANPVFDALGDMITVNVSLSENGQILTLAPVPNWFGETTVPVSVYDETGLYSSTTFNLTVENVNDAPEFDTFADDISINEDVSATITLSASDIDDVDLTYSAIAIPEESLELTVVEDELTILPANNFIGDASVELTVTDTSGLTDNYTLNVNIIPLVDAPIIVEIPDTSVIEDNSISIPLQNNDADGDFSYYLVDVIDNVTATIENTGNDYNLILVPDPNWNGVAEITVQSFDESGGSDTESFNLTVISIDDKPFVENEIEEIHLVEDFDYTWDQNLDNIFTDYDHDLSYRAYMEDPSFLNLSIVDNMMYLNSIPDGTGETDIIVTATSPLPSNENYELEFSAMSDFAVSFDVSSEIFNDERSFT